MHPRNILLIGITRSEKFVENFLLCEPVRKMTHVSLLCKLVLPLLTNQFFTIPQPILQMTEGVQIHVMRVNNHNKTIVYLIICVCDSLVCIIEKSIISPSLSQYCT